MKLFDCEYRCDRLFLRLRTINQTFGGGYKLERFEENGKYYVIGPDDSPGGGIFDGTVEQLGWDQNSILAQVTRLYHGDTNGWYVLDLKTKRIIGPIQEADLKTNADSFAAIPNKCFRANDIRFPLSDTPATSLHRNLIS
jgi:hypothetical protein